jgi:Fe2+-dicitrate sensor, membrane component
MANSYSRKKLVRLIRKYLAGKVSEEEKQFLEAYYNVFDKDPDLFESINQQEKQALSREMKAAILERTGQQPKTTPFLKKSYVKIAVAASLILAISIPASYFITSSKTSETVAITEQQPSVTEITPGGNKAMLTLADGSVIVLDSTTNGTIGAQGEARVIKLDGQLKYESAGHSSVLQYNTVATPKGGQYHIVLSDGTGVWLNAASSIRFPVAFTGKERVVDLNGEAYFEVTKNQRQPFTVNVNGSAIEVLGTHFNVNAYNDENAIQTTLLEGKVKVVNKQTSAILQPGQQAEYTQDAPISVKTVDTEAAIAWKNGLFWFDNVDLRTIMRQLERWYQVDVEFKGAIPTRRFAGQVSRTAGLTQVLKILELSKVHFTLEGNKITVTQ